MSPSKGNTGALGWQRRARRTNSEADSPAPVRVATRARDWLMCGLSNLMHRRPFRIAAGAPVISFTFDDFPRTAWLNAGAILERYQLRATYYVAFGLMGKYGPCGEMFFPEDVKGLVKEGHELGCHTYDHDDANQTMPAVFEASILKNRQALRELCPGISFRSLSYPYNSPRPGNKGKASRYFDCCRSGGQTFNADTIDLNNLASFFLEQSNGRPHAVKDIIDHTCRAKGWLILDTHDVCATPSRFGCTADFFEEIVEHAARSGANILPVAAALKALKERADSQRDPVR
jgi:peptidoglycan/xylan/chitin deacetylase (PgdA/CDA1 family)